MSVSVCVCVCRKWGGRQGVYQPPRGTISFAPYPTVTIASLSGGAISHQTSRDSLAQGFPDLPDPLLGRRDLSRPRPQGQPHGLRLPLHVLQLPPQLLRPGAALGGLLAPLVNLPPQADLSEQCVDERASVQERVQV